MSIINSMVNGENRLVFATEGTPNQPVELVADRIKALSQEVDSVFNRLNELLPKYMDAYAESRGSQSRIVKAKWEDISAVWDSLVGEKKKAIEQLIAIKNKLEKGSSSKSRSQRWSETLQDRFCFREKHADLQQKIERILGKVQEPSSSPGLVSTVAHAAKEIVRRPVDAVGHTLTAGVMATVGASVSVVKKAAGLLGVTGTEAPVLVETCSHKLSSRGRDGSA